jgi:hypothetical protein
LGAVHEDDEVVGAADDLPVQQALGAAAGVLMTPPACQGPCTCSSSTAKAMLGQARRQNPSLRRAGEAVFPLARAVVLDIRPGGEPVWDGWGEDTDHLRPGFGLNSSGFARYRVRLIPGHDAGQTQLRRILDQFGAGSVAWLPLSVKDQPGFAWFG